MQSSSVRRAPSLPATLSQLPIGAQPPAARVGAKAPSALAHVDSFVRTGGRKPQGGRRPSLADGIATPESAPTGLSKQRALTPAAQQLLRTIGSGKTCIHIDERVQDRVMGLLRELVALPAGFQLLQAVIKHVRHVDIIYNPQTSPHTHTQTNGHTGDDPHSAVIEMGEKPIKVYDRKRKLHPIPEYLVLAHEMLHAYHGARWPGLEEKLASLVVEDYSNLEEYASIEGFSAQEAEKISKALKGEVKAQTLREYGTISENLLRSQAGLTARWGHGGVEGDEKEPDYPPTGEIGIWEILMGQMLPQAKGD